MFKAEIHREKDNLGIFQNIEKNDNTAVVHLIYFFWYYVNHFGLVSEKLKKIGQTTGRNQKFLQSSQRRENMELESI